MTKRLPKVVGVMLFLLFIGGTILLPAFHRAHCVDNHATHEAGNCPICQFANTPVIAAPSVVAPIAESVASNNVDIQVSTIPTLSLRNAAQARAPPVF